MDLMGWTPIVVGACLMAMAAFFIARNLRLYARLLARPRALADCVPGVLTLVQGRAVCSAPIASPASARPAVFYQLVVVDSDGDNRHSEHLGCPFWLTDASGARSRVHAAATSRFLRKTRYVSAQEHESWLRSPTGDQEPTVTVDEATPAAVEWGLAQSRAVSPIAVEEGLVAPGQELRVLGRAQLDRDRTLCFEGREVMLCTCDDAELTRMRGQMIRTHVFVIALGVFIAGAGAAVLVV